jgi:putative transposase
MRRKLTHKQHRAYRIQLKSTPYLEDLCIRAKNLYNAATYLVRQELFNTGNWLQYTALYQQLKANPVYLALKELTDSYIPQQVLRQVERVWWSYFKALKAYHQTPSSFQGRPCLPKYLPKDGRRLISFPRGRVRGASILFPTNMLQRGFPTIPLRKFPFTPATTLSARLVPFYDRFVLELIYEVPPLPACHDILSKRIIGLDLGINNLVATSDGFLIKGGVIKTINQWYNKQLAKYQALAAQHHHSSRTRRIIRLQRQRTNKLTDILHQTSRALITHCQTRQIDTILVGYNPQWKHRCNLGKRNSQNFIQIPFLTFIQLVEYKALQVGIQVVRKDEAYTSQQCSNCGIQSPINRRSRGLYQCRTCALRLNADINAARNLRNTFLHSLFPARSPSR